jgi:group II intron reverse transcriptase/maturase
MAQQKSENRDVPKGRRKAVSTRSAEPPGGGKAVPVNQRAEQMLLPIGSAERPASQDDGAGATTKRHHRRAVPRSAPLPNDKEQRARLVSMEVVASRLELAFEKVAANKGAPGPDRQTISDVRKHAGSILSTLRTALIDGTYRPGDIRRVWIPKGGGGQRGLGIPNVVDRVVQEAVRMVLEPLYEPTFHIQSHGFRPERGCHTAIAQAIEYLSDGHRWVVDLDLEKFFDTVNHQRLLARLAQRVMDKRILVLIGMMLKAAVVMPEGVRVSTEEGVPQGGPLSPLLANIVLDELDQELVRRGHRFVRYADDCNIYVSSERSGHRVMASITRFIEKRLRLKVNASKSAVARPSTRHFLGFRLCRHNKKGGVDLRLSERSEKRLWERIRELTPRTWGQSVSSCVERINQYLGGWLGHFGICTFGVKWTLVAADARIRRRLRAIQLKHWGTKLTIARRLIRLGVSRRKAFDAIYSGRKSIWELSHTAVVDRALSTPYWARQGLISVTYEWAKRARARDASRQLTLPWR